MRSTIARTAVLGVGVAVLGMILSAIPFVLELEEEHGLAVLFAARGPIPAPPEVSIVAISRASAEALGLSSRVNQWPRELHGRVVNRLASAGAAVIAFDIIFDQPRTEDPASEARFAAEIARAGNVMLAERVKELPHERLVVEQRLRPIELFRHGALATAPFTLPLYPVRVSQTWAFGRGTDVPALPSAALHGYALPVHEDLIALIAAVRPNAAAHWRLAMGMAAVREQGLQEISRRLRALFEDDRELADDVRAAGRDLTLDVRLRALIELYSGPDSRYLNFYGPARTIDTISYHDVLSLDDASLRRVFEDRVVFVGISEQLSSEQQDEFVTVFSERSGQRLAGVEIGATVFANLLRNESIRPMPLPAAWALVGLWGMLIAAVALLTRGFVAIIVGIGFAAAFSAAAYHAFASYNVWTPLVVPVGVQLPVALLIGLSWSYRILRRQRERIHSVLGYYVPSEAVDRLARDTMRPQANRELIFGTCLVTDAEHYTTLTESLRLAELGELMDAYYEVLVNAVHRHGGIVSDIGGDSMIAVWPAATSIGPSRVAACRAALEVLEAVESFNRARVDAELPTRIGIDAGQLLLGNVGAMARGEYRAVGDIVNTASRLQGLSRMLGSKILISAPAADEAADFHCRPLGEFLLVGKRSPVSVLELQAEDYAGSLGELNRAFAQALERFRAGDFGRAEQAFTAVLERFPFDGASRFFLDQCRMLAGQSEGWDGVVRMTTK